MMLEYTIGGSGELLEVAMRGRLTLGPRLSAAGRDIAARAAGGVGVVLDLSGIEDVDSAGLGELVILYTVVSETRGRLCLLRPAGKIVKMLEMTRLTGLLPQFEDGAKAAAWARGN